MSRSLPHVSASPLQSSPCKGDVITARPRAQVDSIPCTENTCSTRARLVIFSEKTMEALGIPPGFYMCVGLWGGKVEIRKVDEK